MYGGGGGAGSRRNEVIAQEKEKRKLLSCVRFSAEFVIYMKGDVLNISRSETSCRFFSY